MFRSARRKPLFLCLLLLLAVALPCSAASASPPGNPPLRVVMDNNYPPYVFLDSRGELQGILIDQWRLWEQKTGRPVAISGLDWNTALRRMEAGEFDVIDTIFFNEKRAKIYEFSKPYAKLEVPIFFHQDVSGIAGVDSLKGFVVAVKAGDAAVDFLKEKGIDRLEEFNSYEAIFRAARERKVVTFVVDAPPAMYFLYKMGLHKQFRHTAPLYVGEFHRAVRKGDTELLRRIESGFDAISKSDYRRIEHRWFGIPADYGLYLRYAGIVAAAAAVLIILLAAWNSLLRRTVRQKTARLQEEASLSNRRAEALRESEEEFRKAFNTSPDAVNINRLENGLHVSINEGFSKITGYSAQEVIGKNATEFNIWENQEDRKRLIEGLRKNGEVKNLEAAFRMKDGTVRYGLMSASIVDLNGVPHILSLTRDITERKREEEERHQLQERLNRTEKIEALGTLAGGVAHDLNNVLGVLIGYSELMLHHLPPESPLRPYVTKIMSSGQRATAIIQDLLTLARRGVVVSEVINLNHTVSQLLETPEYAMMRSHHPEVSFQSVLDPRLLNIKGSPVHLIKTLMNLVSNAAEAISGPGEVTIRTENRYIDRPLPAYEETREGEYVVLSVSDTGKGIPAADMKRIFEPFYTKKVMGRSGTGLGLAVVWGTVKDHHGYIDVRSENGQGSAFTLYFPVSREALKEERKSVSREAYRGKGERILVVDDVEGQRALASAMLISLGYEVHAVACGEEAVAYVRENPVDLLVLDMIMDPHIDGLETYRRILEIHHGQKAVIVSGFAEDERVKTAQQLGVGAYIRKPYLLQIIGLAVRRELDRVSPQALP